MLRRRLTRLPNTPDAHGLRVGPIQHQFESQWKSKFWTGCPAQQLEPCLLKTRCQKGVMVGNVSLAEPAAHFLALTGLARTNVLQQEGRPEKTPRMIVGCSP